MVEEIPSDDQVSRHVDSPDKWNPDEKRFVDDRLFMFKSPDEVESVVWRKYAVHIDDVHTLGCRRQGDRRQYRPNWTYEGAITALVRNIRSIATQYGDRFEVVHAPDEGVHHAHIEYRLAETKQYIKQRKLDLKEYLRRQFGDLDLHECPDRPAI
ncbi:hypothetical protein [Hydrogenophaga intermedia]|uniref:hypothetical protein n=1 Tax=Hydrogenophaga intermedia TaxID=65786 RepID=UPI002042E449|nr:hypothetical protein [Hydrogenophaga intermedia]MCM3563717.1 hypothetical protein [Hydrogenophaga intermedia]